MRAIIAQHGLTQREKIAAITFRDRQTRLFFGKLAPL